MEQKAGAQISTKVFVQSVVILFVLMLVAGIITYVVPAGQYARVVQDGREIIAPDSYQPTARPNYPFWRWFTAPVEVLFGADGATIIVIILFILMVGSAFAVLEKSGILRAVIARVVRRFGGRKYALLLVISLLFMAMGAFFGIFEEVVPLVPVMLALSYSLGWDSLVGLGMSILATNMGFSAAVTNPFTIGVAQKLAGLPLFSGAWLRLLIFAVLYGILAFFLLQYARRIDRHPEASLVYKEDGAVRAKYSSAQVDATPEDGGRFGTAIGWFLGCLVLIVAVLVAAPLVPALSQVSLPIVGLLFLVGGIGAGIIAGTRGKAMWRAVGQGSAGIAPSIPLILMASSVKHIVAQGGIMDTILHGASGAFSQASPFVAILAVYLLALLIEFFIASGSAKAFLIMPILFPLADLVGLTRQTTVTAYCFGDGFSNLAYPTNAVLLICLGLTVVSYGRWIRWTSRLWGMVIIATVAFLALAVASGFGPF